MVKPKHIGQVEGRLSYSYEVIDEDVGRHVFQADPLHERANLLGGTTKWMPAWPFAECRSSCHFAARQCFSVSVR
jgi:hypothetical protein